MPFVGEAVDDRPERRAQLRLAAMPEGKPRAAVRRAAARRDFLEDGMGCMIAHRDVAPVFVQEFLHFGVQQPAAELVAERVPHDRIHADQPRREMADRKELHELHVDQLGAGAQRERVAVAAHVDRGAVARVEARQAAGGDDRRLRRDRHQIACCDVNRMSAHADASLKSEVGDQELADAADLGRCGATARAASSRPPGRC